MAKMERLNTNFVFLERNLITQYCVPVDRSKEGENKNLVVNNNNIKGWDSFHIIDIILPEYFMYLIFSALQFG